jgi:hypothetical protein
MGMQLLSPVSLHVQGKKIVCSAIQNGTVSGLFFYEQFMKQHCFLQNMLFHLKGKGGKKNMSEYKSVLNL